MATLIRLPESMAPKKYRLYIKGAPEIVLGDCRFVLKLSDEPDSDTCHPINGDALNALNAIVQTYSENTLRTLALAYRDFTDADVESGAMPPLRDFFTDPLACKDLCLIGLVGIEDPLRENIAVAVRDCQRAGIFVRMVSGDSLLTVKAIATRCGIFSSGGIIMDGPRFRRLSKEDRLAILPRLQVLARSTPQDKLLLVKSLQELGEVVAVTGDGTNDAPALKNADVGFSMGISGTEVAKEASSIVLLDDNFSSIVEAIVWGRTVSDAVKKFLQFQLTVNFTAVLVTLVTAAADNSQTSVLTPVQLLWVNLIMDTLAALALSTDAPSRKVLQRFPQSRSASLISLSMWKMIFGQALFQTIISLLMYFYSDNIFDLNITMDNRVPVNPTDYTIHGTLVFNAFVFMQLFNEINCRRLDGRLNVFKDIHKNIIFIVIFVLCCIGQAIIVEFGGVAFETLPITWYQWLATVLIGSLSLPVGVVIRLIPDEVLTFGRPIENDKPYMSKERLLWINAYSKVHTELSVLRALKGGR